MLVGARFYEIAGITIRVESDLATVDTTFAPISPPSTTQLAGPRAEALAFGR